MKFEDLIESPMEILTQISTKLKLGSGKKLNEVFQSHRQSHIHISSTRNYNNSSTKTLEGSGSVVWANKNGPGLAD